MRGKAWHDAPATDRFAEPTDYPRLQFVVVNWNYARYIDQTIASIRDQDYPNISCLVVDNGSADDSVDVIRKSIGSDRRFELIEFDRNCGQLGAVVAISERIDGAYVSFVDSDDFICRNYGSSHIQVHESLSEPVGMTSSNVMEVGSSGDLLSGHALRFRDGERRRKSERGVLSGPRLPIVDLQFFDQLGSRVSVVRRDKRGWLWAPGTSNVYRGSLLRQTLAVVPDKIPVEPFTDTHVNVLTHMIAGSALIDLPLSAYRIHDRNLSSDSIRLNGAKNLPEAAALRGRRQRGSACAWLIRGRAAAKSWIPTEEFWTTLDRIDFNSGEMPHNAEIHSAFAECFDALSREFGERALIEELRSRLPFRETKKIIRAAGSWAKKPFRLAMLRTIEGERSSR
ncbi:glycosyltransferase family 2 protein [Bauldia sp.]|uniref:glycosyltransferase family 2 protein n=1 Tax=Bauldia sp. TaxID=2575872 RepID=UPI003BACA04E